MSQKAKKIKNRCAGPYRIITTNPSLRIEGFSRARCFDIVRECRLRTGERDRFMTKLVIASIREPFPEIMKAMRFIYELELEATGEPKTQDECWSLRIPVSGYGTASRWRYVQQKMNERENDADPRV